MYFFCNIAWTGPEPLHLLLFLPFLMLLPFLPFLVFLPLMAAELNMLPWTMWTAGLMLQVYLLLLEQEALVLLIQGKLPLAQRVRRQGYACCVFKNSTKSAVLENTA